MATLDSCRSDLRSILAELRDIRDGIQRNFSGIGEHNCIACINSVIEKYEGVLKTLNKAD